MVMAPVSAVTTTTGSPEGPSTAPVKISPPAFWLTLSPLISMTPLEELTSPFSATAPVSVVRVISLP